jgi:hypothetical protein
MVNGLDEIAVTETYQADIAAYEEKARRERPWQQQADRRAAPAEQSD